MGFFRFRIGNHSSREQQQQQQQQQNDIKVFALLKTKVMTQEETIRQKDEAIRRLSQRGTTMDASSSTTSTVSSSNSSCRSLAVSPPEDSTTVVMEQLQDQLDEKKLQVQSLEAQLQHQRLLTQRVQARLQGTLEDKHALTTQVDHLQTQLGDQTALVECLQQLNQTNTEIVHEGMDDSSSSSRDGASRRRNSSSSLDSSSERGNQNNNTTNKWQLYGKLQQLMNLNNTISHQLDDATKAKQATEQRVLAVEQENAGLQQHLRIVGKQLDDTKAALRQQQQQKQQSLVAPPIQIDSHALSPDMQHLLDMFANDDGSTEGTTLLELDNDTTQQLVQASFKACQTQVQQLTHQNAHQTQSLVRQSIRLAKSQSQVDALQAKVEHYERVLDHVLVTARLLQGPPPLENDVLPEEDGLWHEQMMDNRRRASLGSGGSLMSDHLESPVACWEHDKDHTEDDKDVTMAQSHEEEESVEETPSLDDLSLSSYNGPNIITPTASLPATSLSRHFVDC